MHFYQSSPDLPLLPHPFAPVRDGNPDAIDGDDHILGEGLGRYREREILEFDPAEEGGVVCRREVGDEDLELPGKPFHLAVGHQEKDVHAGHPRNEWFGVQVQPATFTGVHLHEKLVPLVEEVKGEVELTPPNQAFTLYIPSRLSGYGRPQSSFCGMDDRQGRPSSSLLWSGDKNYSTRQQKVKTTFNKNESRTMPNSGKKISKGC